MEDLYEVGNPTTPNLFYSCSVAKAYGCMNDEKSCFDAVTNRGSIECSFRS